MPSPELQSRAPDAPRRAIDSAQGADLKIIRSPADVERILGLPPAPPQPAMAVPAAAEISNNGVHTRFSGLPPRFQHRAQETSGLDASEPDLGTVPTPSERADDAVYQGLARSRHLISLGRLSLGAQLVDVRDRELWKGRCSGKTFRAFLVEEGIDPRSACQYMQVVRCFVQTYRFDIHELAHVGVSLLHEATQHLTALEIDRLVLASPDRDVALKKFKAADGFGPQPLPTPDEGMREAIAELVLALQRMAKAEARALLCDRIEEWRHHLGLTEKTTATASSHPAPVTTILGQVDGLTLEQRSDLFRLLGRRESKRPVDPASTPAEMPSSSVANRQAPATQAVQAPAHVAADTTDSAVPFWRRGIAQRQRP